MMSCADFMAQVGNYLDGEVAEELRRRIEAHLAQCKSCTVVCDSVRKTIRVVGDSGSFELSNSELGQLTESIMDKIRKQA
ncbi:MAG: zf-HC2 domain-containing protein [Bryobacteraceae bacterium]